MTIQQAESEPVGLHALLAARRAALRAAGEPVPDAADDLIRVRPNTAAGHEIDDAKGTGRFGPDGRPEVTVTRPGLVGPDGVLPEWLTALAARPGRDGEAVRAVAEVLQAAAVRAADAAHRAGRPWREAEWSADGLDPLGRWLIGLLGPEVRRAVAGGLVPVGAVAGHPGLWLDYPTLDGLARVVGDGFGVPARAEPVGRRGVRLHVGPLPRAAFDQFRPPAGPQLPALARLARLYLGDGLRFEIGLWLRAADVPAWVPDRPPAEGIWLTDPRRGSPADGAVHIPARVCRRAAEREVSGGRVLE